MFSPADLQVPIVAAPMAGGPSTPVLVAEVGEAGGLGFLAAGYRSASNLAADVESVRSMTSAPFGVNVFLVEPFELDAVLVEAYRQSLEPEASRLGVDLGSVGWDDDDWAAKVELLLDVRPDVVSFTFGCPSADLLRQFADVGVLTAVTVTTADEAKVAVARGATSIALQGPDAGGHRGTWDQSADPDSTPLLELVSAVTRDVEVPVMAGGGLASSADVSAVLAQGAAAAQLGTAYLLADEAGTNATHRAALADPTMSLTSLTRAYTGRWARGLQNRFMLEHADAPPGYPQLHHLTAPLRAAAISAGDQQVAHLWAGTGQSGSRPASAAAITRFLAPPDRSRGAGSAWELRGTAASA